jgi:hypothetical protein
VAASASKPSDSFPGLIALVTGGTPKSTGAYYDVAYVAFCLVTALFLAWIAPQQVGSRITDTHDPARWLIHRDSVHMFAAHPFLGSGFGSFATAFPRYRVFYDDFFINHAHDDYLELLLETGLAGFGVGVWFIVVLYREGLRNLRPARLSPAALISAAGSGGVHWAAGAQFHGLQSSHPGERGVVLRVVRCTPQFQAVEIGADTTAIWREVEVRSFSSRSPNREGSAL